MTKASIETLGELHDYIGRLVGHYGRDREYWVSDGNEDTGPHLMVCLTDAESDFFGGIASMPYSLEWAEDIAIKEGVV